MSRSLISVCVALALLPASASLAHASGCGWYAIGGAFKSRNSAYNQAGNLDASVYDLDDSNSPNAGKGFYVVALGPVRRSEANEYRREFRQNGVGSAYVKKMCFYGSPL
ncbi:SPOR domain-containing protein [Jiella avicenniae]|uniref:SPOR domain-containing protein n=1 Tax=Jiella avicenniae TaxID=2907202 RepID=A0A9X1P291_9HYPH|nr:SPOR domain-containing protein [Jiella avicenniae]MCE7028816.1 SPOR domain-containing protein [Jiella avicenniae]